MRIFDQIILPLGVLILATVGGFLADQTARLRRKPEGDRGDFWTRVVQRVCIFAALPVVLSGALAVFPPLWLTGRHLQLDLTGAFGWSLALCYRIALLVPFGIWTALLLFGLAEKPGGRDAGRWLAGAIGDGRSRLWMLVWTLPLAAILATKLSDLGGGPVAYPAAAWGTIAVLLLSIIGVALSTGDIAGRPVRNNGMEAARAPQLRPWPEALEAHGLQLSEIAAWPASKPARPVRQGAARELQERLRLRGARGMAPELIEAVDGLFSAPKEHSGSSRLILAPDNCGQVEIVALAAELLDQRFHAATLVVTAGDANDLAADLGRWLPHGRRATAVEPAGTIEPDSLVVVTDAQVLSDRLLSRFKDPLLLRHFGLIVWWHLEAYTGVKAANLWAISRRLHRLLEAMGRHDVRTLAFVRSTPHGGAQLAAFVRHLLPHPLPKESEVHVEQRFPCSVHLHKLESHQNFFTSGEGRAVQERYRHLPLVAAKVSVEEGWSTHLEVPADIAGSEAEAFLQSSVGDGILRERLQPDSASAGARVKQLQPGEILSLVEIVSQGGRAVENGLPHHVGVTLPSNPYVAHLLSTLSGREGQTGFSTSRRLVWAAPPQGIVQRHLLLALDELPDTRSGLRRNFLWNEQVIQRTLDELANEGKLTRTEVRFLDDRRELQREHEYKSQRLPTGERRPLDTVGGRLIDVRDQSAGFEKDEGVRMRVDPERLTIQAYPHRVFVQGGQRYRIREWSSREETIRAGSLPCDREGVYSWTWRIRNAYVLSIDSTDAPVGVGHKRKLLTRLAASLRYQEEVIGWLRVTPDLAAGGEPKVETHRLARAIDQSFNTRGLILRFPEEEEPIALASLAQALRHLLPVHLGAEEDALEVVPLTGEFIQGRAAYGLAVVDLYPGGIGLVDAIGDDNSFLLQLLEWTRDWLAACPCQSNQGCNRCLRSPAAMAANSDQPPLRAAALNLLHQVV